MQKLKYKLSRAVDAALHAEINLINYMFKMSGFLL